MPIYQTNVDQNNATAEINKKEKNYRTRNNTRLQKVTLALTFKRYSSKVTPAI